jgi:hypothetical protein
MLRYKTKGWDNDIEAVEIERETASSIWINGRRVRKDSCYDRFFDSWELAHDHLLKRCESQIENLKGQLARWKTELKKIKAMKE